MKEIEEGGLCPECKNGKLERKEAENCACHILAPCAECEEGLLICNFCKEIF